MSAKTGITTQSLGRFGERFCCVSTLAGELESDCKEGIANVAVVPGVEIVVFTAEPAIVGGVNTLGSRTKSGKCEAVDVGDFLSAVVDDNDADTHSPFSASANELITGNGDDDDDEADGEACGNCGCNVCRDPFPASGVGSKRSVLSA